MYYVYLLKSIRDKNTYIGYTRDLKIRVNQHNNSKVASTRNRVPMKLVYYEAFIDKHDAFAREQWLKTGWGRNHLKNMLHNSLKI